MKIRDNLDTGESGSTFLSTVAICRMLDALLSGSELKVLIIFWTSRLINTLTISKSTRGDNVKVFETSYIYMIRYD